MVFLWIVLTRAHARRFSEKWALQAAVDLFQEWFLGEPACSDEVLPLLTLAIPAMLKGTSLVPSLDALPLYQGAAHGLASFEAALKVIGVASECITYAPWPGCRGDEAGEN